MMLRVLLATALAGALATRDTTLLAQAPTDPPRAAQPPAPAAVEHDVAAAIRETGDAFVAAFNQADAAAVAALWTPGGEYIDEAGRVFTGRDAIRDQYAAFFAEHPGVTMKLAIASLRSPAPMVVIETGRATLDPVPPGAVPTNYTAIHVNIDGQWLMASVRDTVADGPSNRGALAPLQWLVGSWSAEGPSATAESTCRWIANKGFLQRSFRVRGGDQISASGEQIIGWNPLAGALQSWTFTADGGVAVGSWTATDAGWFVESLGATAEGVPTYSTTHIVPLDANAFSWRAAGRDVGDVALPDTEEIILRRVPDKK